MNIHEKVRPTPQSVAKRIESLRREHMTGKAIAAEAGASPQRFKA